MVWCLVWNNGAKLVATNVSVTTTHDNSTGKLLTVCVTNSATKQYNTIMPEHGPRDLYLFYFFIILLKRLLRYVARKRNGIFT